MMHQCFDVPFRAQSILAWIDVFVRLCGLVDDFEDPNFIALIAFSDQALSTRCENSTASWGSKMPSHSA
jgi:hypothetical protein